MVFFNVINIHLTIRNLQKLANSHSFIHPTIIYQCLLNARTVLGVGIQQGIKHIKIPSLVELTFYSG